MFSERQVCVGRVPVGGDAPVAVQSMTNTPTHDVEATLAQVRALATAGADLVRVAVPDEAALAALPDLVAGAPVPLIADVHFDHRLAVGAVAGGAAAVRINPGNVGGADRAREVAEAAADRGAVVRIGVNSGSLQRELRELEARDPAAALVESALRWTALFEDWGFTDLKLSVKSSSPVTTIAANRLLARRTPYPIHLGVTEAGTPWAGSIRSAVALGTLLEEGIGDTIRVSLTGDPVEEVRVAREILRSLELLTTGSRVISCPTCGRTEVGLEALAVEVELRLADLEHQLQDLGEELEVAVMGCIVNGPGEARKAHFGIAGGRGEGVVFAGGRPVRKVPEDQLVDALFAEIAVWVADRRLATLRSGKSAGGGVEGVDEGGSVSGA